MADLLSGLSTAVADRRREKALSDLSTGPGFVVMTIYHGKSPGVGRVDSRTPDAAYKNLVDTFGDVEAPKLLASVVGAVAPLEGTRRGSSKNNPTAGVEFVVGLDRRSLSGKAGVDCRQGRIYLGAMNVKPGVRRQKACGSYVRLYADRPLICSYSYWASSQKVPRATEHRFRAHASGPSIGPWGKKWGKKPHRLQPISADLDLAKTA